LWLAGSPWRLGGAWSLLAGLLASGAAWPALRGQWLAVLLAFFLSEVVWGALWSNLTALDGWPLQQARRRPLLPYVQPGSPAARLLGWPEPGSSAALLRAGLPLALLAVLLAAVIGHGAVPLTLAALAAVMLGILLHQAGLRALAGWLEVLVQVTLPFMLGVALSGPWPAEPQSLYVAAVGAGATLLARAVLVKAETTKWPAALLLLAGAGLALILFALLALQQLIWAALVALLAGTPLWMLAYQHPRRISNAYPWLIALVLTAALGVGLGLYR